MSEIDPTLDLFAEIERLKKEKKIVLLAHYYQEADIQDVADYVGDSLGLAQQAAATDADMICFAGVHFMAETAKILNPHKKVLLPDLEAGCSLAESAPADLFEAWVKKHPGHQVVSYINCTAAVKALSDVIVTSSNAAKIVSALPKDQPILFAPDKYLGAYVQKESGRDLTLWQGTCQVHEIFSEKKIRQLKIRHPQARVIAHPECTPEVLDLADHIGSTSALLKYAKENDAAEFIVVTEPGIIHQMEKACPDKTFIPGPPTNECACNECPYMRLNTLEKLYLCMRDETPEITLPEDIRVRALKPIERMLAMSA
ncbi:MAG: quinolinate synthase NadA [Chrysiogenetes bacterium]|nr:quinolinate synthase NadA [Chrysiogenetes bacterium]